MEKPIESIWKESFSKSELSPPLIDNLYNQKSKHLTEKFFRMSKLNFIAILVMAVVFWIIFFFLDAPFQGSFIALFLLGLAWYGKQQMKGINKINPGLNSYEYLVSFDKFINDTISKNIVIMRFLYPLIFLTTISVIWFANNNQIIITNKLVEKFPDLRFVGGYPLNGLILTGIITLLIAYFADRIYKWDVNLIYGRFLKKIREAISELEDLIKKGDNNV